MKFLSVCSGIEAASVAWHDLGFECVGVSEIDKFPSEVLKYHYPSVPNLGDMTNFKEWNDDLAPDLLVGGTPCQSFSVAGLRKGMDDPRGNLALTYVGIAEKYKPQWFIWENVPGVLSSNGGKDFSSFLSAMANIGYGIAYRVLDAQFFGVPQRRRRVFVVGYLGDWRPAVSVLFESTSVFGHTPKGRKKGKGTAASPETSPRANGRNLNVDKVGALLARDYKDINTDGLRQGKAIIESYALQGSMIGRKDTNGPQGTGINKELMFTITSYDNHAVSTVQAIPYDLYEITAPINRQNREVGDPCHTLARDSAAHASIIEIKESNVYENHPTDSRVKAVNKSSTVTATWKEGGGNVPFVKKEPIILMDQGGSCMQTLEDGLVGTLRAETHGHEPIITDSRIGIDIYNGDLTHNMACTITKASGGNNTTGPKLLESVHPTLTTTHGPRQGSSDEGVSSLKTVFENTMRVRRLTPVECERLQGFPDNWTQIPYGKKPKEQCPDGHRYKALGNSMAVPVMKWIGRRIALFNSLKF